jgi:hypothetical protein
MNNKVQELWNKIMRPECSIAEARRLAQKFRLENRRLRAFGLDSATLYPASQVARNAWKEACQTAIVLPDKYPSISTED